MIASPCFVFCSQGSNFPMNQFQGITYMLFMMMPELTGCFLAIRMMMPRAGKNMWVFFVFLLYFVFRIRWNSLDVKRFFWIIDNCGSKHLKVMWMLRPFTQLLLFAPRSITNIDKRYRSVNFSHVCLPYAYMHGWKFVQILQVPAGFG